MPNEYIQTYKYTILPGSCVSVFLLSGSVAIQPQTHVKLLVPAVYVRILLGNHPPELFVVSAFL
jgi:hypothetical protein